jgi:GNAT superfamily N-acetyltransferase
MQKVTAIEATHEADVRSVVSLLRDYALWMRRRYMPQTDALDDYFDPVEWQSELSDLPGHYGAPHGAIVLARVGQTPAGCVLMRGVGETTCEMRRLFVRPAFRRLGVGAVLAERAIALACARHYSDMKLEVGPLQHEALSFYDALGFRPQSRGSSSRSLPMARFIARPCEWQRPATTEILRAC